MGKKKLPRKVIREVDNFVRTIQEDNVPVERVLVFGSYAKGKQKKWSDIDVCIVSPRFQDAFSALQYLWRKLPNDPDSAIEPVGFTARDFEEDNLSPLTYEIKKHGIQVRV
jgi:predicted nucleotidyltransferase